jgi:hypothetical protein
MKFAILTAHNEAYQDLTDITWEQNRKQYAIRHGYGHHALTDGFTSIGDISWARTRELVRLLESGDYDWVHVTGGDTMITNFNITYDQLVDNDCCFIITTDCWNINADSFLARATPECIEWLKYLDQFQEQYSTHAWNDQQCIIDNIERLGDGLKVVPQRLINSYDYDQYPGSWEHMQKKDIMGNDGHWQPGDFMIQWPGIPNVRRIPLAQQMLTQVIQ